MAGISDAAANLMLDWLTVTGSPTRPTTFELALYTVNPDFQTGVGGTEATGGGYDRIELTMDTAASRVTENTSGPHEFIVGTNLAAGDYTGWGVYSDNPGGTFLGGEAMSETRSCPDTGDKISFAVGAIILSLPNS